MSRNPANYGSITDPVVGFSGSSDLSRQFTNLCDGIVTNVFTINSSIKTLQDSLKAIGTPRDNTGLRNNIHVTNLSANQVAAITTKDITALKLTVPKNDKQRQLQVEKLEGNFKEAVNKCHALQKELAEKQKAHLLVSVNIEHQNSDEEENADIQRQAQISREMQFEQEMMLEREQRVKQIEADVLDVNAIMRELGSIVHAQAENIDTLENYIDQAVGNVEEGTEQLMKASGYQTRYRKKMLILILVIVLSVAILITVFVMSFKKS